MKNVILITRIPHRSTVENLIVALYKKYNILVSIHDDHNFRGWEVQVVRKTETYKLTAKDLLEIRNFAWGFVAGFEQAALLAEEDTRILVRALDAAEKFIRSNRIERPSRTATGRVGNLARVALKGRVA